MSLQVLMAPPASGKTQFGVQAVRDCLTEWRSEKNLGAGSGTASEGNLSPASGAGRRDVGGYD